MLLEARNLFRFYHAGDNEVIALHGVSLDVDAGELVAVTGPSGSGKSTLLACLAGLDEPDGGSVRVSGSVMSRRPESERAALRARLIGMLFQSNNLVEHLTLSGNVELSRHFSRGRRSRHDSVLARLGLADRAHAWPSQLSGGETVRAGVAVALANDPPLLLADEPTGELDRGAAARVLDLLRDHTNQGGAVVVVTHSAFVASAAHREIRLEDGRVVP